ncbi:MAG TPA: hypothetical protein VGI28_05865 [Stellaceae bacterium]|jgi:hypothetical protein
MFMKSQSGLLDALDPLSRSRIRIFSFKLLVLFPFSMLLAARYRIDMFAEVALCAFWYGFFSGLVALVRREPVAGPSLNGWDEVVAFFALKYLAQFLSTLVI